MSGFSYLDLDSYSFQAKSEKLLSKAELNVRVETDFGWIVGNCMAKQWDLCEWVGWNAECVSSKQFPVEAGFEDDHSDECFTPFPLHTAILKNFAVHLIFFNQECQKVWHNAYVPQQGVQHAL